MFKAHKPKNYFSAYKIKGIKQPKFIWFYRELGGDKNHARDLLRYFCKLGYKVERFNVDCIYMVMSD